ncbi:MAG: mannonate dehydratase [Methylobacteriaceae bacterium]|jgi:mannonate dehydratase|nr:mannonate dehydratase [Methylobacteriaceae bacterium]
MRHVWRWFGPIDKVTISDARQAGAEGIVSALHHIPYGAVWTPEEIEKRCQEIARMDDGTPSTLTWDVVESLPVSEDIKTQTGNWKEHIDNYRLSMNNLAAAGLRVICYNFMPVLDWTRTDLRWKTAHGGTTMRYDLIDFAAFDLFILRRPQAFSDYPAAVIDAAGRRAKTFDDATAARLVANIRAGLPGATEATDLESMRRELADYADIDADTLRGHFIDFLSEIVPLAEQLGLRFCCHPDDPPWPMLGLPRITSTEDDYVRLLTAVDSPANGITFCTGALGARADNDLPGMVKRLGPKIHFAHLRSVRREDGTIPGSFHEDEHLAGDIDLPAVVTALLDEEARRAREGRGDAVIPMRPDHGQDILTDTARNAQPGYPAIGRLKGLAELKGVERGLKSK